MVWRNVGTRAHDSARQSLSPLRYLTTWQGKGTACCYNRLRLCSITWAPLTARLREAIVSESLELIALQAQWQFRELQMGLENRKCTLSRSRRWWLAEVHSPEQSWSPIVRCLCSPLFVQGKLARPSTKLQQGVASDLPTRRDLQLTQAIGNQRFGIMLTDVTLPEDA